MPSGGFAKITKDINVTAETHTLELISNILMLFLTLTVQSPGLRGSDKPVQLLIVAGWLVAISARGDACLPASETEATMVCRQGKAS